MNRIVSQRTYNVLSDTGLAGIERSSVFSDYLFADTSKSDIPAIERKITRNINIIIKGCDGFKIGKSGSPFSRKNGYGGYLRMFLLFRSRSRGVIEYLEAYYNQKYHRHRLNDNVNLGSAGVMTNSHHLYFLYIVIR